MSSSKPGMFGRLKRAISGTINDAVDSISDPGQELALLLDDLATQIKEAEKDLKQGLVDKKVMERKLEDSEKSVANWTTRSEQAVKLGDDKLARAALERKGELTQEHEDAKVALAQQAQLVEDMGAGIKESKKKLKALNQRRGTLMAQARAAKKGEALGSDFGTGAASRLDEIEGKIAAIEAYNEVLQETDGARMEEAAIDAKLAALDDRSAVDDELDALKAKMKAKGALTEGDKEEADSDD
jgi:phage shock protein A